MNKIGKELDEYKYCLNNLDFIKEDRYTHNDNEEEDSFYRKISIFEKKFEYENGKIYIKGTGICIGNEGDSLEELAIGASANIGNSVIDDDFLKQILKKGGRGYIDNQLITLYKNGEIKLECLKNSSKTYIENLIK